MYCTVTAEQKYHKMDFESVNLKRNMLCVQSSANLRVIIKEY
jgi:hypothetical protein